MRGTAAVPPNEKRQPGQGLALIEIQKQQEPNTNEDRTLHQVARRLATRFALNRSVALVIAAAITVAPR